jgi:hypothetical protein
MKNALNRTGKGAIMSIQLANIAERQQTFIMSSHKQTKLSQNIEVSAIDLSIYACTEIYQVRLKAEMNMTKPDPALRILLLYFCNIFCHTFPCEIPATLPG